MVPTFGVNTVLLAQAAAEPGGMGGTLLLFGVIGAIWYFLVIRPQVLEQTAHQDMVSSLMKGDTIVTRGGLIVKVVEVKDSELVVDLGNTRARLEKNQIARKFDSSAGDS